MQALRQRTAQAIAQVERRQKLQSAKKSATLRRERENKEVRRNAVLRKNRFLVKQEAWERQFLGELKSSEGWLSKQREKMPEEMAMSKWERNQQKRLRMLQAKLKITEEAMLLEKEERRRMPEWNVAVSLADVEMVDKRGNVDECCRRGIELLSKLPRDLVQGIGGRLEP